jgi:hypothetical protein
VSAQQTPSKPAPAPAPAPAPLPAPTVPPAPVLRDQAAQLAHMVTQHLGGPQ